MMHLYPASQGCISEFCGLTVSEIEFGEMRIKVDHQLQRTVQMQYVLEEPKLTKASAADDGSCRSVFSRRIIATERNQRLN